MLRRSRCWLDEHAGDQAGVWLKLAKANTGSCVDDKR